MNVRSLRVAVLLSALPILVLMGCSKDKNNLSTNPTMGTFQVRMTDAPGAYQAVNLVVREVAVIPAGADSDSASGWIVINHDSTTVNLIQLQNGVFRTLGAGLVPAGMYDQIRLKLGPGSTVVVNGVTYPLTVPSGMQSGLKLNGPFTVPNGGTEDVVLDFDANRSIIQTGNGTYILKPVIRVLPSTSAGAIRGTVSPTTVRTTVYALGATADTVGTAITSTSGAFLLSVLPSGTYNVAFHPDSAYHDTTLTGVSVTAGSTTNVGTVTLRHL